MSAVTVRQSIDPEFSAKVVAVNVLRDIALLSVSVTGPSLNPLQHPSALLGRRHHVQAMPLALGSISTADNGQALMALGYSLSGVQADGTVEGASAKVGVLSQIRDFGADDRTFLQLDAPIDPGDSGGPVLDMDGLVVGMSVAAHVGTFYAVHVDKIRAALPSLKSGQST